MRVLFMGRKPAASEALRHLVEVGAEVVAVVAPQLPEQPLSATYWRPLLRDTARSLGIPVVRDQGIYDAMETGEGDGEIAARGASDVDLVISFLFWKKILKPIIDLPRIGCFNFHPAPLPGFRGRRGYNFAILEGETEYGASCHWVSEKFDEGDLVEVRRFPIHPRETALSLERKTMTVMLEIFKDFIADVTADREVARIPQGPGRSATKAEMLAAMKIDMQEPPEAIDRRIRAFWYPPHHGAYIEIGGRRYTLVDQDTLDALGCYFHRNPDEPS